MVRLSGKIRRILVEARLVDDAQWLAARDTGQPAVDVLIDRGILSEKALFETLGKAAGVPPVDVTRVRPDPAAVEALPQETCLEHCVLPIARDGDVLTVAVSDPFDVLLLDDLNILAGSRVKPVLSYPSAIRRALETLFDSGRRDVDNLLEEVGGGAEVNVQSEDTAQDIETSVASAGTEDGPAVRLVNMILLQALKKKASDIHVEPCDRDVRVRIRVDGRLVAQTPLPRSILAALISRLKILANLDIAERFTPQDGKFQVRYEGRRIDFRLSTLPVVGGEKAVMRILDASGVAVDLNTLGFEQRSLADIEKGVTASYGMVLVTGPTGSGKSTTLYACVRKVATPEINVVTVEDPVEYRMDGVNQVPVNPKRGMTFAGALRSILRQDPDVVLVGEIRDTETAEIAVKAALTGHMVLSTLHTNDAPGAVTRLVDMGVDPYLVSSSILCVAAQRLARTLCSHCKVEVDVPEEELVKVGFLEDELNGLQLYGPNGEGCPRCTLGYKGRFALLETLYLDSRLKRMVVEGRSVHEIKAEGIAQGMLTLRRVGLLNVIRGKTSLEEVLRVTMNDK
jgi:type IV pilus assembly protein PilB